MELLRFATIGSVDDGKSTLIGRLLYDSQKILDDQLSVLQKNSEEIQFALLTDGLRAEREQGITIDVAYRYFETSKRKFIVADCPGHVQYTRNAITGLSNVNAAVILIDATRGIQNQTKRHAFLVSLLQVSHLIVCVNKMDRVSFDEAVFREIREEFENYADSLTVKDIHFIPMSALRGDNVVRGSENMPWYSGRSLLDQLEELHISSDQNRIDFRFPVQQVLLQKGETEGDSRYYLGRVASGGIRVGEKIQILPSGFSTSISAIYFSGRRVEEAHCGMSVQIQLEDPVDVSRGDMIARLNNLPKSAQDLSAIVFWMTSEPLDYSKRYYLKQTTQTTRCVFKESLYRFDVETLHRDSSATAYGLNDIGRVSIRTANRIHYDAYRDNRKTGSFTICDPDTKRTIAGGILIDR